jgi:hypothetical protein
MLIEKKYEIVKNLAAIEMFGDIDQIILDKLRREFEGRCRENTFIVKILKIVTRSSCRMVHDRLDGSGTVNVVFLAQAIEYKRGDILPNCVVKTIEKGHHIICTYGNHAVISIQGNKTLQSLRPGQRIPVLVRESNYPISHDKITVYGFPYTYPNRFIVYSLTHSLNEAPREDREILREKFREIVEETLALGEVDAGARDFLIDVYYPYQQPFSPKSSVGDKLDLVSLTDYEDFAQAGAVLCRHRVIEKSTPLVMRLPSITQLGPVQLFDEKYKFSVVFETPARALMDMMDDHLNFIRMLREMSGEFSTEEKRKTHENVWNIYRHIKK